ncbi:hypothetical protein F511_25723 [Dorcoceras hygrometricum]|uniref:Uncharacterized protein n=1 Tax=Dorcoceras hygrometricum TaxID=472368 RepID=A0A2Z7B837_9LAMI|nr:hypothetical protein F511_25723 [Dorcoceras hygrometricum]
MTDLCCSDLIVAAVCGNYSSEAGEVTDLCCSDLVVAAVCGNYSSEAGFSGFAAGRGYDPTGGTPGGG